MADTRRVKVVNMVNKTVGVRHPEFGVNLRWNAKGQPLMINYDILEQLLWNDGFRKMIDRGILYIDNMQDKIDLGLEPEGATEPENILVLKESKMKELLTTIPFVVFKKELQKYNLTQIRELVNYAIAHEIIDMDKATYLKDITGLDIVRAVSNNREVERAEANLKAR